MDFYTFAITINIQKRVILCYIFFMGKNDFFNKTKRILKAVLHIKRYDNIIPLGYNCETAFRFYVHYKFIESSLLTWVYIDNFDILLNALQNLSPIATDDFAYEMTLYKCLNSGIRFHGRTRDEALSEDNEESRILIRQDKEELRSRIKYLKEKFVKTANDGKKNLYVVKISEEDAENPDIREKVTKLYNFLNGFCKNKFDFLIITEDKFFNKFLFNEKNIYTRSVEKYAPDETVTNKKMGDKFGWNVLWTEFRPKKHVWKKKKLKFEQI